MLGVEGVANLLAGMLSARIGDTLDGLALEQGRLEDGTDIGADPVDGVMPQLIVPRPPRDTTEVRFEDWPFVAINMRTVPRIELVNVDEPAADGGVGEVYACTYRARVLGWVRGDGYELVGARRDRLILALRQAIITNRSLGPNVTIDPTQLSEDYSPIGVDAGLEATVAAGFIDIAVRTQERVAEPTLAAGVAPDDPLEFTVTTSVATR